MGLRSRLMHSFWSPSLLHTLFQRSGAALPSSAPLGKGLLASGLFGTGLQPASCTGSLLQRGLASQRPLRQGPSLLTNYKQLSKFKLSSLVVLTAGAGFVAGSEESIDWARLAWTSLGTFGAAACANTLNQIYEIANDRCMSRTCNRPLPAGRLSALHAAGFAAVMGTMGLGILYHQANPLTAALGASNILLYAGIYTPLKQLSPVNTWVGAVVGAIPPLMGWASASGGTLEPGAAVLAGALFSWQMPHFMALAWMCKEDYMRGGFRMLSATDATGRRTALVALRHSLLLLPLGFLAVAAGAATEPFAWEAAALGTLLTVSSLRFVASPSTQNARSMFKSSLLYLPLLLVGAAVHRLPNNHSLTWEVLQSRLEAALSGAPSDGFLPLMRSAAERSAPAVQRLFGLGQAAISELRCPSTVYSDAGEDVVIIPQQNADGSTTLVVESVKAAKHRVALSVQQATSSSSSTSTSSSSVAEVSQDSSSSSSSLPSQHLQEKEQQGEPQPSSAGASTLAVKWKWAASRDRP